MRLMVFPLTCASARRERIFKQGQLARWQLEQTTVLDGRVVVARVSG
jgi:hypothetical protein